MLIIGERINSTRKSIKGAVEKKDTKFIQQEALFQVKSGADMLDVNCGMDVNVEADNMEWLVKTVQGAVDVPLVIDSPSAAVIERGVSVYKNKQKNPKPIINSITAEPDRIEKILSLVKKYNTGVVALTMDETGMPTTAEQRVSVAEKILDITGKYGVPQEDVYFDPLVRPISTEQKQTIEFLESIKLIKNSLKAKTVCGLSNISFGLPERNILNSTFLAMAVYAGLDAAIIDPTNKQMIMVLRAAEALMNKDEYCSKYIAAYREKAGELIK